MRKYPIEMKECGEPCKSVCPGFDRLCELGPGWLTNVQSHVTSCLHKRQAGDKKEGLAPRAGKEIPQVALCLRKCQLRQNKFMGKCWV